MLQEVQLVTTGVPAGPPAQWAGLWRVSYAPHIRTLGNLPWAYVSYVGEVWMVWSVLWFFALRNVWWIFSVFLVF